MVRDSAAVLSVADVLRQLPVAEGTVVAVRGLLVARTDGTFLVDLQGMDVESVDEQWQHADAVPD